MTEQKITCNQCGNDLYKNISFYDDDMFVCASVCTNPKCSCYALVQIPLEHMPKEDVSDE